MNFGHLKMAGRSRPAWLVAVVIIALCTSSSSAATYYVDFAAGVDSNNGTSTGTPWLHCPGDASATSVPASTSLAAGDEVIFKGGTLYTNNIVLKYSGTSGQPITYDGNSAGTFGTGQAILDAEYFAQNTNSPAQYYILGGTNTSFVNINNFEIRNISDGPFWTCGALPAAGNYGGCGVYIKTGRNDTVSNCYIHDIGYWQNVSNSDAGMMNSGGVYFDVYSSNVTVANCEFTKIGGTCVGFASSRSGGVVSNILILNCNMHDYLRWGISLAANASSSTLTGVTIDGLQFHDYYEESVQTWLGCAGDFPHIDGIIMYLGGNPTATNCHLGTVQSPIVLRNSFFYNNYANLSNTGGNANIYTQNWGGRFMIYNNVFANVLNAGNGAIYFVDSPLINAGTAMPDFHVCNNTFYDEALGIASRSENGPTYALTNGTVDILNNLFYFLGPNYYPIEFGLDPYSEPTELDYDVYITVAPSQDLFDLDVNGSRGEYTFPAVRAVADGMGGTYEKHGVYCPYSTYQNLIFLTNSFGIGAGTSSNNFHIQQAFPGADAGTNLTAFFTTDYDGNPRPAAGPWTIGAYQYEGLLSSPLNLRTVP